MPYNYTPMTPNFSDPMNVTQPLILENFQAIQEYVAVDHVGFNTPGFGGHNIATMPFNTAPTTPEPVGVTMYTAATGSPNAAEIFAQFPAGNTIQLSGTSVTPGAPSGKSDASAAGWCQFTSGVIFMWGTGTYVQGGNNSGLYFVSYTGTGIPVMTNSFYAKINPGSSLASTASFYGVAPAGISNNVLPFPATAFAWQIIQQAQTGQNNNTSFPYTWFMIGT